MTALTHRLLMGLAVTVATAGTGLTAANAAAPDATGGGCKSVSSSQVCIGADKYGSVYATGTYPVTKAASCRMEIRIYKNGKLYRSFAQSNCQAGLIGVDTPDSQHGTFYSVLFQSCVSSSPCSGQRITSPKISG